MTSDGWRATWLFSLLDYEHWQLEHDGTKIGQLILNAADRHVSWTCYDDVPPTEFNELPRTYGACHRWVLEHES